MLAWLAPVKETVSAMPEGAADSSQLALVGGSALAVALALLVFLALLRRFLFVCRPNELLVVAGKRHKLPSGDWANYTVILAGAHWRVPFLQTVSRMDIRLMPIELR